MRESEKARVFTQAIDLLVEQAVAAKRPDSPGAYAATVRSDLSSRLREVARDVYAERGEVDAAELAAILAEHEQRPAMALDHAQEAPAAPAIEPWNGPEYPTEDGPVVPAPTAKERIAAIRQSLRQEPA